MGRREGQSTPACGTVCIARLMDRLERAGLIRRHTDAADRRRVLVEVTEEARQRLNPIFAGLLEAGTRLLRSRYTEDQLAVIADFLAQARALATQHTAAIRQRQLPVAEAAGQSDAGPGGRRAPSGR